MCVCHVENILRSLLMSGQRFMTEEVTQVAKCLDLGDDVDVCVSGVIAVKDDSGCVRWTC